MRIVMMGAAVVGHGSPASAVVDAGPMPIWLWIAMAAAVLLSFGFGYRAVLRMLRA